MWYWSFRFCWVSPNYVLWVDQRSFFLRLFPWTLHLQLREWNPMRWLLLDPLFFVIEVKAQLKVDYIEIYPAHMQNGKNFPNIDWISRSERQFYEWIIVSVYLRKYHVKTEYSLFVRNHVTPSYSMVCLLESL